nr:zinc finger, RING/FYVE/PHD-type [Tanacetum cinerariifolium]
MCTSSAASTKCWGWKKALSAQVRLFHWFVFAFTLVFTLLLLLSFYLVHLRLRRLRRHPPPPQPTSAAANPLSTAELGLKKELREMLPVIVFKESFSVSDTICPFFNAFLVTADVPEIYLQEFWATTTVHYHSIRFKMDTKKHIIDLESFRDILHICPRVPGQPFAEPPFEEEILAFIRFLGHREAAPTPKASVRRTGSSSDTSITPPTAAATDVREIYMQEFWATTTVHYHSIRFKMDTKKHIIDMESFRDILHICLRVYGQPFTEPPFEEEILAFIRFLGHSAAIRTLTDLVSRHQNTQQFDALLPIELTNDEIRNSKAYKEYYTIATGEAAPKPKSSVRRTRSSFDTSITPPTAAVTVLDVPTDESEKELSWNSTDDEGDDNEGKDDDGDEEDEGDDGKEGNGDDDDDDDEDDDGEGGDDDDADQEVVRDDDKDDDEEAGDDEHESDEETQEEESFDPIPQTLKTVKMKGRGLQGTLKVEDTHVTLTTVKPDGQQKSSSVSSQFMTSLLNLTLDVGMESIFETTSR